MIKFKDIEEVVYLEEDKKYLPMIKKVHLPNFVKCVAVWSTLIIDDLDNDTLIKTLLEWAKSKYHLYEKFGGELKVSKPFEYQSFEEDTRRRETVRKLSRAYPIYAPWLGHLICGANNVIEGRYLGLGVRGWLEAGDFQNYTIDETKVTSFFKRNLEAPDELVEAIAAYYEDKNIQSNYTISIDPVDIMLASENPYNWTSCYKLDRGECYADGCMAAIVDETSMIGYVGEEYGDLEIANYEGNVRYTVKDVAYKRMRQWIAANENFKTICLNLLYPNKDNRMEEFLNPIIFELLTSKEQVEGFKLLDEPPAETVDRVRHYGYASELINSKVYRNYNIEGRVALSIYQHEIRCFCGCGEYLPERDDVYDTMNFNSEGFKCENYFEDDPFCEIGEERCHYATDRCEDTCGGCSCWREENGVDCDYGREERCFDVSDCCSYNCCDCDYYLDHCEEEE